MTPVVFRVRGLRLAKGWSQPELANRSGAPGDDLRYGKREGKRVDLDLLEGLAGALDCDGGDLMVIERDEKRGKGRRIQY